MAFNYTIRYRTFDELLASASNDFKKYQLQNLIDPQDLIKVVKRVNYDLGLRIHKSKERLLEVEKNRVRLPNDFYTLDFALVVSEYTIHQYLPQGTHTEERIVGKVVPEYMTAPPEVIDLCAAPYVEPEPNPCNPCPQCGGLMTDDYCKPCCTNPNSCTLTCNGDVVQLVQKLTAETRYYKKIQPLRIVSNNENLSDFCRNKMWEGGLDGEIKEGWLYTSFQHGKVYLNYQGMMEDDDGNLLAPDHDGLNDYYEYAIKQRILENLLMNDEDVSQAKIQLIEARYKTARTFAVSLVNTPNFTEMREVYQANRNAQYNKYYDMFLTVPRITYR